MEDPEDDLLYEARRRLTDAYDWWQGNFANAEADTALAYDDQWPAQDRQQREAADRPALNFNILPQFIHQVCGNLRRSKFSIRVMQTAGVNDPAPVFHSQTRLSPAEVMDGLIRDIEARSGASHEYVRAFQHAVEGGFGWLILDVIQTPEDPFHDEIRILHERDRYSVLIDPAARRSNFSDARWASHSVLIDRDTFERQWPDAVPDSVMPGKEQGANTNRFWGDQDTVRVVRYWRKVVEKEEFVEFLHPETRERQVFAAEKVRGLEDELREGLGYEETRRAEFEVEKVRVSLLTGSEVLEGEDEWPSRYLPVIPVLGREIDGRDDRFFVGLLRWARDPQMMLNFWVSAITERISLAPKAPFIAADRQINPYIDDWNEAHTSNKPVLLYKPVDGIAPPARQGPAVMPAAEMQGVMMARQHVGDAIGMHDANVGRRSNEVSGRALQEREDRGNTGTFDFFDNLRYALGHMGDVLCDMIPNVYANQTVIRLLGEDGKAMRAGVNLDIVDEQTGRKVRLADLSLARYTCVADIGPEASTQRTALLQTLQEVGRSMPEFFAGIADLVVQAMDLPMKQTLARRLKKMVPRNLLSPEEQEQLGPQEPSPQEQAEMAQAQAIMAKAESDVQIAQAKVQEAELDVQRAKARQEEQVERSANALDKEQARDAEGADVDDAQLKKMVEQEVRRAVVETLANR